MERGYEEEVMSIDEEIARLLLKRIDLLKQLGLGYESIKHMLISRRKNVVEVLNRKYGINSDDLTYLISYIDGITLKSVKPLTIGFLGPRGSFSEEASLKMFGSQGALSVAYTSIGDIFRGVESGDIEYGVIPLENSLEGSVGETLDMLAQSSVKICGETELRISLNLIAKPGTRLEDVRIVLSHPMALAQCRNFIYSKLRNVRIETRSSTSEAVKEAVEQNNVAAIGSELAASIYGGEVIVREIEDYKENYTRFIAIGYKPLDIGVGVKTSIILTLKHMPGSLYRALEPFAVRGINLTKIESRPIKGRPWEYMFFVDFVGSIEDTKVREALEELTNRVTSIKILGSYRKIP